MPSSDYQSKSGLPIEPVKPKQGDEDFIFAQYVRHLWLEQEDKMRPLHDTWIQNILFLTNRQWWRRTSTGSFEAPQVPRWRKQPVSNLALAFYRTFLAKATKNRPAVQVVPASADPQDIKSAQLGEQVIEAKWIELRLGRILRLAVAWTIAAGNAFLYPFWNTRSGKLVPATMPKEVPLTDDNGEIVGTTLAEVPVDEDGNEVDDVSKQAWIDQGDIGVRVFSPFQVRVNPDAEDDDHVEWFIVTEPMLVSKAKELWPEKSDEIQAEDVGEIEHFDRMLVGTLGPSSLVAQDSDRDRDLPKVLVHYYHEKPCPEYPGGRYWVCCNNTVLLEGPMDLPDGFWPALIHLTDVVVPGRYYAASTLEAVIPLNREYNELNQQVAEHHALLAKGKWLVPKNSGVTKSSITTEPGEVIVHVPGLEPRQAKIEPLPEAVYRERERILSDLEMVSGIHKVSMGQAPPGVTAGVAFMQLQEADDTDIGPFLAMLEETVAELARALLTIIRNNYDTERLIYVAGPNRRYMVKAFKGSDLSGAVDVIPVAESSFPWSKTARQNIVLELLTKMPNLFMDPMTGQIDGERVARHLAVGGLDSLVANNDIDVQEALREEEMFEAVGIEEGAEIPMVEFWQNHPVHLRQHFNVLKSAAFKEWSPEAQQSFIEHVQLHQSQIQAAVQGMAVPPGAAPAGEPSPGVGPEESPSPIEEPLV